MIEKLTEPVVIIGEQNQLNTEELTTLVTNANIRYITITDSIRGVSVALIQKGSKKSLKKAVESSPVLSKKQFRQIVKELENLNK